MSISLIVGSVGSGKSFEAVRSYILPALLAGRRVVSNIDGLDEGKCHDWLLERNPEVDVESLGTIVSVSDLDIEGDEFYPAGRQVKDDDGKSHMEYTVANSIVHPGDLVAIDEAYKFYSPSSRIRRQKDPHFVFMREHRHYVSDVTHNCVDLVLITQGVDDFHRCLKPVIKTTAWTKKWTTVFGAGTNKYGVAIYENWNTKYSPISQQRITYDKTVFPLYKSYKGGKKAKEVDVDKRATIWGRKHLLFAVLAPPILCWAGYTLYQSMHPETQLASAQSKTSGGSSTIPGTSSVGVPPGRQTGQQPEVEKCAIVGYVLGANGSARAMQRCPGQGLSSRPRDASWSFVDSWPRPRPTPANVR